MQISKIKLTFGLVVAAIVLCGCTSVQNTSSTKDISEQNFVVIALVGGTDTKVQAKIRELLKQKGIVCGMEGSIMYTVLVRKEDAAKASQLLHSSPELRWMRTKDAKLEILQLKEQTLEP